MAKNVFKPTEITLLTNRAVIDAPKQEETQLESAEEVVEYTGPTADDLRREAEAFRAQWEEEKQKMVSTAHEQATQIVEDARRQAEEELAHGREVATRTLLEAEDKAKSIEETAESRAEERASEAKRKVDDIRKKATEQGKSDGRAEGYRQGEAELKRLVDRLHSIINATIEKRSGIIEESETQLIDLVLLVAKKVVKVISESQKNVVVNNVLEALKKLKNKCDVTIRVSLSDLELTTEHTEDFVKMVENVTSVTIMEDSSVGSGGCVIETDFGHIDARISSQLHEIEERIKEIAPIRAEGSI